MMTGQGRQRHRLWLGSWSLDQGYRQGACAAGRLKAGTVWINCYNIFDAALPFRGYKQYTMVRKQQPKVLPSLSRPFVRTG